MLLLKFYNCEIMKMKIKYLWLILVCGTTVAVGQTTVLDQTLNWASYSQTDLYGGQVLSDTFQISINKTSLNIIQGETKLIFVLESLTGNWQNLNESGQLMFEIPVKTFRANGVFERDGGLITLTLDFSARPQGLKRRYTLTASE
jgi:hypothetical protein